MRIPENILVLIEKYQTDSATAAEIQQLNEWYRSFDDARVDLQSNEDLTEDQLANRIKLRLLSTIRQHEDAKLVSAGPKWKIPAVAATILLLLSAGLYFAGFLKSEKQELVKTLPLKPDSGNDVAPGGNKAMLTLADGTNVILDSANNGLISHQGNTRVQKLSNGLLVYTINGKQVTEKEEAFYNTISTPRGGQYQVTLADGTKVWLNAASSIRFPVVFTGSERKVVITGEAYFEVAKNKDMPFRVNANNAEIEVLGTHFNINAYEDEPSLKTTLLEGSVKVSVSPSATDQISKYLVPGQQAGILKSGKISVINNADIEETMAWKNGRFQFESSDLKTILRQIARWYDVDIEYRGNVNLHFTGQLTRNEYVSKVFEKLELTGEVHFKIEGKKIIVTQ